MNAAYYELGMQYECVCKLSKSKKKKKVNRINRRPKVISNAKFTFGKFQKCPYASMWKKWN